MTSSTKIAIMPSVTFNPDPFDNDFYWGNYGNFKVLIMKSNGYINATKLCQDGGKEFSNWKQNYSSKALMNALENSEHLRGIPGTKITILNLSGIPEVRGTYVHLHLVPHIGSWISPEYAVKVGEVMTAYHKREEVEKNAKLRAEIFEKDDKISKLEKMLTRIEQNIKDNAGGVSEMSEMMKGLKLDNEITHTALNEVKYELDETNDKLDMANDKLDAAEDSLMVANKNIVTTMIKLGHAAEDRVVKAVHGGKLHTFAIMKYNDTDSEFAYHALRRQKTSMAGTINKFTKLYPDATKLVNIDYNPNAILMFNVVKDKLKANLDINHNNFNIVDITEADFVTRVNEINAERRNTDNL